MSGRVRATETFHHGEGTTLGGTELSAKHPIARAFPMFFEEIDEPEPAPKRPALGRLTGGARAAKPAEDPADG